MAAELMVVGFDGKHRAAEVLNQLEALEASWAIDLKDAVAAYRSSDGRLHVDRSIQPTTHEGAAWGAIIGGLIGALVIAPITLGATLPASIAAISAGAGMLGVTGAVFGADDARQWKETTGISDAFVKQVGGMVQPGQSALFVLARASDPAKVEEQFRGYGGKVLRTTLSKDAAAKFQELMNPVTAAAY
jgi:uncharacterized membrane protein